MNITATRKKSPDLFLMPFLWSYVSVISVVNIIAIKNILKNQWERLNRDYFKKMAASVRLFRNVLKFRFREITFSIAQLSLRLWYWPCAILAQSSWKIRPIHSFLLPLFPSVFSVDGAVVEEKKQLSQISYFLKSYSNLMPSCLCLHYRHAFFIKILLRSRLDFKILLKVKLNEI